MSERWPDARQEDWEARKRRSRQERLADIAADPSLTSEAKSAEEERVREEWRAQDYEDAVDNALARTATPLFRQKHGENDVRPRDVIDTILRLTLEMKDVLPRYETVLSDDASARLVTLYFKHVIDALRERNGDDPATAYFLSLGRQAPSDEELDNVFSFPKADGSGVAEVGPKKTNSAALDAFIASKRAGLGKTLVVTEHIGSGGAMSRFIQILAKHGVDFDVAAVSVSAPSSLTQEEQVDYVKRTSEIKNAYQDPEKLRKLNIFAAWPQIADSVGLFFYNLQEYTGIVREHGPTSAHPVRSPKADSEAMHEVRKDMKAIADEALKLLE